MITITRYTPDKAPQWDSLVDVSRAPALILHRRYMDYHADRFADHSLLAYSGKRLIAMLPASPRGTELISHPGLTFGGWITARRHLDAAVALELWEAVTDYMRAEGFTTLTYRPAPWIYDIYPADDDLYALFRLGATLTGCHASTAIPLDAPRLLSLSTRQSIARATDAGVTVAEAPTDADMAAFHRMLTERLREAHGVDPVHTLDELLLLRSRFPDSIRLLMARDTDGTPLAGTLVYLSPRVAHTQYMATTARGRELKALTLLVDSIPRLLRLPPTGYLDFGSSCEQGGRVLNAGLTMQKSGLGGRTVVYSSYTLNLANG